MTGADEYQRIHNQAVDLIDKLSKAQGVHLEEGIRAASMMNYIGPAVVSYSARLFREGAFDVAHDLIMIADEAITRFNMILMSAPDMKDTMGQLAEVLQQPPEPVCSCGGGNALTPEELAELGLEP